MIVNNLYISFGLLSAPASMAGLGGEFWDAFVSHLDWITTLLGLAYILLEYRASIWLWLVGFVMQALDIVLYYDKGLYADCGMEFYYIAMTIYGFWNWRRTAQAETTGSPTASPGPSERRGENSCTVGGEELLPEPTAESQVSPESSGIASPPPFGGGRGEAVSPSISHFKSSLILPWTIATLAIWAVLWYWLTKIGSTVPVADAFTTALSFVGIWALARKYLEQWLIWIAVDIVTCVLYFYKDIPFKASLYGVYVVIAVFGYIKWRRMMLEARQTDGTTGNSTTDRQLNRQ